jgi:Icc-related predicted phosphoesterase
MIRIICISDTHGLHRKLDIQSGDLLIHSGDITDSGEIDILTDFNDWLKDLDCREKVIIPGNHDLTIYSTNFAKDILTNGTLLIDEYITFEGYKIYGSPWTPVFGNFAYQAYRGSDIKKRWNKIPRDTDILITHGPPYRILDRVPNVRSGQGCKDLLDAVKCVEPILHVFGHLHGNHGKIFQFGIRTQFVNASSVTEGFSHINEPIVVTLHDKKDLVEDGY